MYGPTGGQMAAFLVVIAIIGGALVLGVEHCGAYVLRHVELGWK